jgi:hypothetical protein
MVVFKKAAILIVVYFIGFIFIKEIVMTHRQWVPNRLFVNHNQYNHTLSPNFPPEIIHEEDHELARTFKINSLGLREDDEIILPKPEKEFRIFVVGDSFILGSQQLIRNLEARLNAIYGNDKIVFRVINCGVGSYSAMIHLARFKNQLLGLDPDAIIYFPDLTDVYDDTHRYLWLAEFDENKKLVRVKASSRILRAKRRHKRQANYFLNKIGLSDQALRDVRSPIRGRYHHIFDHAKEDENKLSLHTEQELSFTLGFIRDYIGITRSNQIHLSIAMYPHLPQIIPEKKVYESDFNSRYNRVFEKRVQELSQKEKILFKSFYEAISQQVLSNNQIYLHQDMHFNEHGFQILAELVIEWVVQSPEKTIGFLPKKTGSLN